MSGRRISRQQWRTIDDAKSILSGPDDAATQYFQKTTQTNLYAKFYPIDQKATEQTGVTAAYKKKSRSGKIPWRGRPICSKRFSER